MNIMIMGQNGKINKLVYQEALERGFTIEFWRPDIVPENKIDVVIDFSSPKAWVGLEAFFKKYPTPFVSGTTGLTPENYDQLQRWSLQQPVYHSANFSQAMALMRSFLRENDWSRAHSIRLFEHHCMTKKDRPSGTALQLAADLNIDPEKIEVSRGPELESKHWVLIDLPGESLFIRHVAEDRKIFATAALDVACWLKELPPGQYSPDLKE